MDDIFSDAVKLLGLIRATTSSFISTDNLLMSHFVLVRYKLEASSNSFPKTHFSYLKALDQCFSTQTVM